MAVSTRSYAAGKYLLLLEGKNAGFVKSIGGGGVSAEVTSETSGPEYYVKKHLGSLKYDDFTMQIGPSMSRAVYDWIADSWTMNYRRMNGSVVTCDFQLKAQSEREFANALITETTIPAMDSSGKSPCYLAVKFAAETIRFVKAPGQAGKAGDLGKSEHKLWMPSNFRLAIDGLDCSKVSQIDSFTVRQKTITDDVGQARDYTREPSKVEFPNLAISLAEVAAQSWVDWHEDFVIKGNNDEKHEKNGSLVFLAPNSQTELGRVTLFNLGIFRLTPETADSESDKIQRVQAELYCERMEFKFDAA